MKVAIVDDSEEMLEMICKYIINSGENIEYECFVFQKPKCLLDRMGDGQKYDIYFVDIKIPEISGIELAKRIRKLQSSAYIVFITSYTNFVLTSYDVKIKAYHYIMKDNMQEKIPEVLQAIHEELEETREDYYIIQNKLHYEKIKIMDIMYIYKQDKNSIFVTREGICKERKALGKVMKSLGKPEFLFIDSGRIVNIRYIRKIEGDTIVLMDGSGLYASRANIKRMKNGISDYWRGIL